MKFGTITISVNLVPRTVDVEARSLEDNKLYSYSGRTRKAAARLKEFLDKLGAVYPSPADEFEQNVSTDGTRQLLPGP